MQFLIRIIGGLLLSVAMMAVAALLLGLPVMWLWNDVMTTLFRFPFITFWQALELVFLSGLLLKTTVSTK